ncbi:MAG TPA: hypothetical protein IGS53_02375 [Leptolyngbyaceae cyanobacterium M33_DOE_097]|uniref:Uncharacterized protein n=1 Tax=Oscillatoriales cyanobacterium SpSt-418 TaxID=2282169 RepID=A0A7C3KGC4_9CYAN|nr:hypothetical protein [Leptolyngbyaceae cyanobacterium M33_DOE_097]
MNLFLLKVLVLSLLLSVAIKYGGPYLPVQGNQTTVLTAITLPSIVMAIALGWRWFNTQKR